MNSLEIHFLKYIRYYVLTSSLILAAVLYFSLTTSIQPQSAALAMLGKVCALIAVGFLYLAMLCSPLYVAIPQLPFKAIYTKSRRALGVSAFVFGFLHFYIEFFEMLGGFAGLSFLKGQYLLAVILGLAIISILFLMTITSTDFAVRKLGKAWKWLHRFVYLVGIMIVIHALAIGSHFVDLSGYIPTIFFALVLILLILESFRAATFLSAKYPKLSKTILFVVFSIFALAVVIYIYANGISGVHSGHN